MTLATLLDTLEGKCTGNRTGETVEHICFDSRQVKQGSLFVAVKGVAVDGHNYIEQAVQQGARIIVCERATTYAAEVLYIEVKDSLAALATLAKTFYGNPSSKLRLVGITGTNGKTSTATLLYKLFTKLGYQVGLISTVENRIGQEVIKSTHTTPDTLGLNALLAEMNAAGCEFAFMEVSSHAIHQRRIEGLTFEGAVFSNISHDHLDYHKTFKEYIYAKKQFFDDLPKEAFALTNIDDKRGEVMLQNCAARTFTYGLRQFADFKVKVIENNLGGLVLEIDSTELHTRLAGDFNAYNLLAVYATAKLLGAGKEEVLQVLSELETAAGRFDCVYAPQGRKMGIVDYAHTPDALEKVLQTIVHGKQDGQEIITVVGCGGNRDTEKRPKMARIACLYSTQVILTSDNPRNEAPTAILDDMEKGVPSEKYSTVLRIEDRRQAIRTACKLAKENAIVLVAGKGHETYQEVAGKRLDFNDKIELINALHEQPLK
jgi:UDP-N-acetylmuramoyl-L-alanyl-D-glutamate--2,6-diaminopimelate ligase